MSATEATLGKSKDTTALESVRRLEERLEGRRGAEEAARARIAAARGEAERIVREARERAEKDAAEDRREALARADEEAERVTDEAGGLAATLRALAEGDRTAAACEVVAMVWPAREPARGPERGA